MHASIYHPQTNGLVERFNGTLKRMLQRFVDENRCHWPKWLPFLLFAIREAPQASTGYSPFELLYSWHCRGILDVLREEWESELTEAVSPSSYLITLRDMLKATAQLAKAELRWAQARQKERYDAAVRPRAFAAGQRILLLFPSSDKLVGWKGPYEVVEKVGEVNYKIHVPGKGIQ